MSSSDLQTYCVELHAEQLKDPKIVAEVNHLLDLEFAALDRYTQQVAKELSISEACAADVVYLRSRSRHTPELEAELIRLHKAGTPPLIYDFGHNSLVHSLGS